MVLQIKSGLDIADDNRHDKNDNFYLGPPVFSKIVPARLNTYSSRQRVWLLSDRFAHQSSFHPIYPEHQRQVEGLFPQCPRTCTTDISSGPPFPTPREEKLNAFKKSITSILSCIYAVFIVTLGIVIYVGELMTGNSPVAEVFSIYLVIVGLCYFAFLYVDMRRYFKNVHGSVDTFSDKYGGINEKSQNDDREGVSSVHGSVLTEPLDLLRKPHHYCLSKGRHSESFYLKVGAAGFCLGHLIHSGLLISSQVAFLVFDPNNFYRCSNIASLILDVLYPTYSFFQLFIIFKYSNVIINKHKIVGRFALMHCIGSNLCFWVWTILRETVDSLYNEEIEYPASLHHVSVRNFNSHESPQINATKSLLTLEKKCHGPKQFRNVFETFSPYLYPFTIEYSILVVGVLFVIWQNIDSYNKCYRNAYCKREMISNVVLYADCHSSNKGLFAGLIVLAGSFLSIILFFVAMTDNKYIEVGLLVNSSTELILLLLMTMTIIPAYRQIIKLDINNRPVSSLDGLLLFTSIPAFFVLAILSFIPSLHSEKYLNLVTIILQLIQVLIQTPFIIDGLRRCSNSKSLRAEKPGRELLTFLIVCNVAMWITETFEIKSHSEALDPRSAYFGKFLWSTIVHLTFPLTMFYRFHSSVCMVDIWKSAYAKGE